MAAFHNATIENLVELLGAAGLGGLDELEPKHINRRVEGTNIQTYAQLYPNIAPNCLLNHETIPNNWKDDWIAANARAW